MKKIILLTSFLILALVAIPQKTVTYFYLGLKGGGGSSLLFNQPSFDDVNIVYNYFSPSYFYGGTLGFLFGNNIGISAELNLNTLSEKYDVSTSSATYNSLMKINTLDFGILLSLQSNTGLYFNVGPKFSNLKKATYTFTDANNTNTGDRTSKFAPTFNALMFEIGLMPVRTDQFVMNLGVRGTYGFSSIVSQSGYIIPADDNSVYYPPYIDEKTNPIQLMLSVEMKYYFGRYGRASCGKYRFMFN